jgi:hypothetical protein
MRSLKFKFFCSVKLQINHALDLELIIRKDDVGLFLQPPFFASCSWISASRVCCASPPARPTLSSLLAPSPALRTWWQRWHVPQVRPRGERLTCLARHRRNEHELSTLGHFSSERRTKNHRDEHPQSITVSEVLSSHRNSTSYTLFSKPMRYLMFLKGQIGHWSLGYPSTGQ